MMLTEVKKDANSHTSEKLAWSVIMKTLSGWIAFGELERM